VPRDRGSYEETKDRLPRFWAVYPTGRITTDFVVLDVDPGRFVCRSRLYRSPDDVEPFADGWCEEHYDPDHMINKAYALENCETGAIGRALANGGFASQDHERPTGLEMAKVERQTGVGRPATDKQLMLLTKLVEERGLPDGFPYPVAAQEWTMRDASQWLDVLNARPREGPAPVRVATNRDTAADLEASLEVPRVEREPTVEAPPWRRRDFPYDGPHSQIAAWWAIAYAAVPGVGHVKFLKAARELAKDLGIAIPDMSGEVREPELVNAMQLWLDNRMAGT
jgi:hypothetical protein